LISINEVFTSLLLPRDEHYLIFPRNIVQLQNSSNADGLNILKAIIISVVTEAMTIRNYVQGSCDADSSLDDYV